MAAAVIKLPTLTPANGTPLAIVRLDDRLHKLVPDEAIPDGRRSPTIEAVGERRVMAGGSAAPGKRYSSHVGHRRATL